jgi:hypothetical protein
MNDLLYLAASAVFGVALLILIRGCERLGDRK